jgi:hypothetical protein
MTPDPTTPATEPIALTFADIAGLPATMDLLTAGRALGIDRTTAYTLARGGDFPCPVLRVGGSYRVPTVRVLQLLGLDAAAALRQDHDSGHARSSLGLPREVTSARA